MFVRPFRVKSSVQLKTSEKKKFRHQVEECFSNHPELTTVLPNKGNVVVTKLLPHNDKLGMIQVHSIDKVPLFMTLEEEIPIPTIHALWKIPDLLPRVMMPYVILDKLLGGADLMLPGIYTESYPENWGAGDVVAVCGQGNGAALAVGIWAVSKDQAIANGFKGKGVCIYQVYQDQLWHFGTKDKLPNLPPPDYSSNIVDEESAPCAEDTNETEEKKEEEEGEGAGATEVKDHEDEISHDLEEVQINVDEVVMEACYRALKYSLKQAELPILTSTFYSKHVKPCCSSPVDIKKTSFKKVGVLLKELEKEGIAVIKEQKKGVFNITAFNIEHEALRGIRKLKKEQTEEEEEEEEEDIAVIQAFTCNAHVTPFFSKYGKKKGDVMNRKQMRESVTDYIKKNEMSDPSNKKLVILDPLLSTIMRTRATTAGWNEIMQKIESNCGKCFVVSLPDKFPVVVKGDLPPIQFKVEKRTGNKKVTIISNFEIFGIEAKELAQKLQVLMSSSASVVPGVKSEVVQCQGDARKQASKLLLEQYKIPRKFVATQ